MSDSNKEEEKLDRRLIETKTRQYLMKRIDTCDDYQYEEGERFVRQETMIKIEQETKEYKQKLMSQYISQLEKENAENT